jgi:hypothetical protein
MNPTFWVLVGIGVILVLWGTLKPINHISFIEQQTIVKDRQPIMKELENVVDDRMKASVLLRNKAIKLPLGQYYDLYIAHSLTLFKPREKDPPIVILNALLRRGFLMDNLYYRTLKEGNDTNFGKIMSRYTAIVCKVKDKILRQRLSRLWSYEHQVGSANIWASLSLNNPKIPNDAFGRKYGLKGKRMTQNAVDSCLEAVKSRIEELRKGEDL